MHAMAFWIKREREREREKLVFSPRKICISSIHMLGSSKLRQRVKEVRPAKQKEVTKREVISGHRKTDLGIFQNRSIKS